MRGNGASEPARPLTSGPVQRPIVCAFSALSRAWRAALEVGDDERVAAPCDQGVISTRNSNSLFTRRWLRARDLNQRLMVAGCQRRRGFKVAFESPPEDS